MLLLIYYPALQLPLRHFIKTRIQLFHGDKHFKEIKT
jgi:hypothetical protein